MTGLDLRWPWLAAALAVLVLLLLRSARTPTPPWPALLVAHSERLRSLPRYRTLARRELAASTVCAVSALVLVAGAGLVAARPERTTSVQPEPAGRDVMLCLDASGAMNRWNGRVAAAYRAVLSGLDGDRLGVVVFSGAPVTILPLTDDYDFARVRLRETEQGFATGDPGFFTGVHLTSGSGQIGDGIASCVQRLGPRDDARGRAVVVASANDPVGAPVLTLPEAARVATRSGVVVYGVTIPDLRRRPVRAEAFEDAVESTGGTLATIGAEGAGQVVRSIQELEEARLSARPIELRRDDSGTPFALALLGLAGVLLGVLLRRRS